jgi:hypothetical protein
MYTIIIFESRTHVILTGSITRIFPIRALPRYRNNRTVIIQPPRERGRPRCAAAAGAAAGSQQGRFAPQRAYVRGTARQPHPYHHREGTPGTGRRRGGARELGPAHRGPAGWSLRGARATSARVARAAPPPRRHRGRDGRSRVYRTERVADARPTYPHRLT